MPAKEAIHAAAVVRLRPIMMTTFAAVLGAVPLAIGIGHGRVAAPATGYYRDGRPDPEPGLYAYTTPVIYLYLDRLRLQARQVVFATAVEPASGTNGAAGALGANGYEGMKMKISSKPLAAAAALLLSGCLVGPDYHRPQVSVPATFRELPGWTQAEPNASGPRAPWWTGFITIRCLTSSNRW